MHRPQQPMRHTVPHGHAFSLVELLVVVAIVSVLAALLLPTLQESLEQARSIACVSNERQFLQSFLLYTSENNDNIMDHSVYNSQGRMAPYFPAMVEGNYLSDLMLLICPTAPSPYYVSHAGFSVDVRNRSTTDWPSNRYFWMQQKPTRQNNPSWPFVSVYDAAMGTYYYWGGAMNISGIYGSLPGSGYPGFHMRMGHVVNASKYAVLWDQDVNRQGANGNEIYLSQSPHVNVPGHSYAFIDGHAQFIDNSRFDGWCTAAISGPSSSWFKMMFATEHITPVVDAQRVCYYLDGTVHGTLYYNAAAAKDAVRGILNLP